MLTLTDDAMATLREDAAREMAATHERLMKRVCGDVDMWEDVRPRAVPGAVQKARDATKPDVAREMRDLREQLACMPNYAASPARLEARMTLARRHERRTGVMAWRFYFDKIAPEARAAEFDRGALLRRAFVFPAAEDDWISQWTQKYGIPKVIEGAKKYALATATHKSAATRDGEAAGRRWQIHSRLARDIFAE